MQAWKLPRCAFSILNRNWAGHHLLVSRYHLTAMFDPESVFISDLSCPSPSLNCTISQTYWGTESTLLHTWVTCNSKESLWIDLFNASCRSLLPAVQLSPCHPGQPTVMARFSWTQNCTQNCLSIPLDCLQGRSIFITLVFFATSVLSGFFTTLLLPYAGVCIFSLAKHWASHTASSRVN